MTRGFAAANAAILDDAFIHWVAFLTIDFDSDPIFYHTDLGTITTTTPAATWLGLGDMSSLGAVQEAARLSPYRLEAQLSLVDETADSVFDEMLNQNFYQRAATLYLGFRNTVTGALVDQPEPIFSGTLDNLVGVHGGGEGTAPSFVNAQIESELILLDQANGEMYSNVQLQSEQVGDVFFQHLERQNRQVKWGPDLAVLVGDDTRRAREIIDNYVF